VSKFLQPEISNPASPIQRYLHIQLFSRFRDYFGTILLGLPYVLVVPLTIRLHKYPMVLVSQGFHCNIAILLLDVYSDAFSFIHSFALQVTLFSMIWTVFAPIQTLFDLNLSMCFFLFCPKSLARMDKISFFALCCLPVPLLLNVVDQW
jgi:hypothetical protein